MNVIKSSTKESIQAAILKQCVDVYLPFLTEAINHATTENFFSRPIKKVRTSLFQNFKRTSIPLFKKEDLLQKANYRPVSLLPHVSKAFERTIL